MFLIVLVMPGVQPADGRGGSEGCPVDVLIVEDIEQSLIAKEVAIL